MSITFKRFHASARLSEETTAYDTDVLFEGKPIGSCRNDGRGGQGLFRSHEGVDKQLLARADDWARQQVYRDEYGSVMMVRGEPLAHNGIEDYCDTLAAETLANKQELAQVRRILKKAATFSDPARDGDIFSLKGPYTGESMRQAIEKRYPGAVVLNALPVEEAVALFREQNRRIAAREKAVPSRPRRAKP